MDEVWMCHFESYIRSLHGCDSTFVEAVSIQDSIDERLFDGMVYVFDLHDHPIAPRAYAWSYLIEESELGEWGPMWSLGNRSIVAVLHEGPVGSPESALRIALARGIHEQEMAPLVRRLTPRARRILARAPIQSNLPRGALGVEHIVLAVLTEGESVPAQVLNRLRLTEIIQDELERILRSEGYRGTRN